MFCLLLADDVTGACDAAAPFAVAGRRTVFRFAADDEVHGDVTAISTESRGLEPVALPAIMAAAARRFAGARPDIVFKKIDSTLRGNAGIEVELARKTFGLDVALVTPAFPAMNRKVADGYLRAPGSSFAPIDMAAYWSAQGVPALHVKPARVPESIRAGVRFISVDAETEPDLDEIVAAGLRCGRRVLWAGSAGLSRALARHARAERPAGGAASLRPSRGCLFCLGSNHPVTTEQESELLAGRRATLLDARSATPESLRTTIAERHVVLRIAYGRVTAANLRALLGSDRPPLAVSGGDTASLVFTALGIRSIDLQGEIDTGIPWGRTADGSAVATKSGGFGAPDAMLRIADFLSCR
jgi:uncharacterized protein YgbK (DUF1537 family)